jgi:hypothetical protein
MSAARRGRTWWDTWNDESSDELQVAMNLLAMVRRDRAFSREVVRAFGMTRTSQAQARRPARTKPARGRLARRS